MDITRELAATWKIKELDLLEIPERGIDATNLATRGNIPYEVRLRILARVEVVPNIIDLAKLWASTAATTHGAPEWARSGRSPTAQERIEAASVSVESYDDAARSADAICAVYSGADSTAVSQFAIDSLVSTAAKQQALLDIRNAIPEDLNVNANVVRDLSNNKRK